MLTKEEKSVVKKLWHGGNEIPMCGIIVMVNTSTTCVGKYMPESNKVRNWYDLGSYVDVNFTPKCHWAYLNELHGKDVWGFDENFNKCVKL